MYIEKLKSTLDNWLTCDDEWLFENFRAENVKVLPPNEAFSLIDETVQVLLAQEEESSAIEVLETVICLARTSATTEVPEIILSEKDNLINHFEGSCDYAQHKIKELLAYYRV